MTKITEFGIAQIHGEQLKNSIAAIYSRHTMGYVSEFTLPVGQTSDDFRACPAAMRTLLKNPFLFEKTQQRLDALGVDKHLKFMAAGDDAIAFLVDSENPAYKFVVKITTEEANKTLTEAYNGGMYSQLPQLLMPYHFEAVNAAANNNKDDSVTIIITPFLTRDGLNGKEVSYMSVLSTMLSQQGYQIWDRGVQNVMLIPHDENQTPFLIDCDALVKSQYKTASSNNGTTYETTIGGVKKTFQWEGLQQKMFPALTLELPHERIAYMLEHGQIHKGFASQFNQGTTTPEHIQDTKETGWRRAI